MDLKLAPVLSEYLREVLLKAAVNREPVYTYGEVHRGIGKTTALVSFAKELGFTVIVPNNRLALDLRLKTGYENIVGENQVKDQPIATKFVYDDGVDPTYLKKTYGIKVITGFKNIR
ncbi:hypothetical protein MOE90_20470 [Bacillus spizizenii]|nr:hypothetical protein [Bacillus spizizenii]MCY9124929.1 hypothetical protein [Bacillus spizizenii]